MDPVVRFRQAVCLLGRFPALAGVDLEVGAGEIVLLQGPNGAGKTTVLRACAGLVPVVDGTAEVLGVVLFADAPGRLPPPLKELAQVVVGGAPRSWLIPWIEAWRYAEPTTPDLCTPAVRTLVDHLRSLAAPAAPAPSPLT